MDSAEPVDEGISRRDALKRTAMIGGAAFVIPAVTTFSMDKAFAQTPSGGYHPPRWSPPPPPPPPIHHR